MTKHWLTLVCNPKVNLYSLHEIFNKFGIKCWNYWKKGEKCEQSIECKPNAENRSKWGQLGTLMPGFQQVVAFCLQDSSELSRALFFLRLICLYLSGEAVLTAHTG